MKVKKKILLDKKLFILCNELKKQLAELNSWAGHLRGLYCKIWTAKATHQNSFFHAGPVQAYNKSNNFSHVNGIHWAPETLDQLSSHFILKLSIS